VHLAHRDFNVIVSGYVLQRKRVRVLPGLGQKRVTQRLQARIRVRLDLFAQLRHLLFKYPGPEWLPGILRAREHVPAVGLFEEPLEYRFHFAINDQLPFSRPPLQTALDDELTRSISVALIRRIEAHSPRYRELLQLLDEFDLEYLIVGGFAVMKYGEPRYTKDHQPHGLARWAEGNVGGIRDASSVDFQSLRLRYRSILGPTFPAPRYTHGAFLQGLQCPCGYSNWCQHSWTQTK